MYTKKAAVSAFETFLTTLIIVQPNERKEYLVPTKATLFGLDVRFRHIEEKIAADKAAKSISRLRITGGKGTRTNRHNLPKSVNPHALLTNKQPRSSYQTMRMKTVNQSTEYTHGTNL